MTSPSFDRLTAYLQRVPSLSALATGVEGELWWAKFQIDIAHPLAWRTVQELGHVLNYMSLEDRLPTVFKPVSPPPYLNGGPQEFLSCVIEATSPDFSPDDCAEWLEGRLPDPVDDEKAWDLDAVD